MKHIFRVLSLVMCCIMILASVPMISMAEETSETYVYGDLPSSVEYIESLEEFDPNDYENGNARSSALPESVDLSTSPYFPPIGSQEDSSACSSFASVYYQFTYEVNKSTNTVTTPDNTFCPYYIYGLVGVGNNLGSTLENNYDALRKIGCIRYSDTIAEELDTKEEKVFYWSNNDTAKFNALKIRSNEQSIKVDCTDYTNTGSKIEIDQAITFNGDLRDYSLDMVKRALSLGKVVTTSVYYDSNKEIVQIVDDEGISHNEYVITQSIGTGNHAIAIVGYDDNFEVDANGDNIISTWERGAFKIANSWGTNAQNHNNGYIWVMYDAFNKVSACPDSSYNDPNRKSFLRLYSDSNTLFYSFFTINILQKDIYLAGKVSFSTNNRYKLQFLYGGASADDIFLNSSLAMYPRDDNKFAYSEDEGLSFSGNVFFDFTDYDLAFANYCTNYNLYFGFLSNNIAGSEIVNSCSVIDDHGEEIAAIDSITSIPLMALTRFQCTINLNLGDLDYDGVVTMLDYQLLRDIIADSGNELSNVKAYLADVNEDGNINSRDSIALKALIYNN